MIENEIASGINARATTKPAKTSLVRMRGVRNAVITDGSARYRFDLGAWAMAMRFSCGLCHAAARR